MKTNSRIQALGAVVALGSFFLLGGLASPGFAAVLTWDPAGNGSGSGGGGDWNASSWYSSGVDGAWFDGNDAWFGGSAGAVSLSGPVSANNIFFNSSGYNVSGSVLTLTGGTVSVPASGSATISSGISGSVGLFETGAGTLTLNGAASLTGPSTISGGTLLLNTNAATDIAVGSGSVLGTLGGTGSANSATLVANAGIQAGSGGSGSLSLGALTFQKGAKVYVSTVANYQSAAAINVTGSNGLSENSGTITFYLGGAAPTNTTPQIAHLIHYSGQIQGAASYAYNAGGLSGRTSLSISTTQAGYINLIYSADWPIWTGGGSGVWSTASQSPANWKLASNGSSTNFRSSDAVVFDDSATGTTAVSISTSAVYPTTVTFKNNSLSYTVSGAYGIAQGALTMSGSGTVTIATSNSYTGGTTLNAGRLNIANAAALGAAPGTLTINGGTIDNTSGGALTLPNYPINLNAGFTFGGSNPLNLGNGSVTLGNTVALRLNGPAPLTIGGGIAGQGSGVSQSGPGMLVLGGSNTYTGPTSVNGGTLSLGSGGSGSVGNTSAINLSNNATVVFNHSDAVNLSAPITGSGNLVKAGGGTLTLGAGTVSYSGATSISGGVLRVVGQAATTPVTANLLYQLDPSNSSSYVLSGSTVSQISDVSGQGITFYAPNGYGGPAVLSGSAGVNGLSVLHFDGTSLLALSSPTTPQAVFIVNRVTSYSGLAGILGGIGDYGIREINSANGSNAWQFGSGNSQDYASPASGGAMAVNGVQVPSTANGAFTLNAAQVLDASNGSVGSSSAFSNGTGLGQYYSASSGTPSGRFYTGDIGEVLVYSSTLTPSQVYQNESYLMGKWLGLPAPGGANNVLPTTTSLTISNGGTFDMSNGAQTLAALSSTDGKGSRVLLGNGVLTLGNTANTTFDGAISGPGGSVVLQGSGVFVFSGSNTYTGDTTLSSGTLQLGDRVARNGSVVGNIANSTAVVFANPSSQTYGGVISGGGSLTKTAAGVLMLTAAQGYGGPTSINGGVLRLPSGNATAAAAISGFGASTTGSAGQNDTWTFNTTNVSTTPVTGGSLTLTDGVNSETRTAFYDTKVPISGPFTASFVYTATGSVGNMADGVTFIVQNSGLTASGGGGGSLGYTGIGSSGAVALILYPAAASGSLRGTNFFTGGVQNTNTIVTTPGVNLGQVSGDPMKVVLTYDGSSTLTESMTDTVTLGTFTTNFTGQNFASLTGGTSAYIGFTGATGGLNSGQVISDFNFVSSSAAARGDILPVLTALFIASGGTLDLNGSPQQVASLTGAGVITSSGSVAATFTVGDATTTTFSGSIVDGSGRIALKKVDVGTLVLSGTNNYTGGTIVADGTLILTNNEALADGSSLTVGDPSAFSAAPVVPSAVATASAPAVSPVPEPGTLTLAVMGVCGAAIGWHRCRRRARYCKCEGGSIG